MSYSTIECQFNDVLIRIWTQWLCWPHRPIYLVFFSFAFSSSSSQRGDPQHRESEDIQMLRNSSCCLSERESSWNIEWSVRFTCTNKFFKNSYSPSIDINLCCEQIFPTKINIFFLSINLVMKMVKCKWHFFFIAQNMFRWC